MYPSQVTREHIQRYGKPTVKVITLGERSLEIVNFPITPNRSRLAREFAEAGVLMRPEARDLYTAALEGAAGIVGLPPAELTRLLAERPTMLDAIPLETWEAIGKADGLPEFEPIPAGIQENMQRNRDAVDFKNVVFDQNTVDTLWTVLTRVRDTNLTTPQPTPHTLLMGPPGTSKSKIARMVSAIVERPFFQVNAEQVSPELIKEQVSGESAYVGSPVAEIEELVHIGGLRKPATRREYLHMLSEKPLKAFTGRDYLKLAELEGLEKGTIYTRPGKAFLAKKYGGELNLTEINCLRGDAITLLTGPVLDVYTSDHPNYTVIADANPANEKHHNRFPLPPEIVDRFGNQIAVYQLEHQQLVSAIRCQFTGVQPTIKIEGKSVTAGAHVFGVTIKAKPDLSILSNMLTPKTLEVLAVRVAKLHRNIEDKIDAGLLDRRESERPRVAETTTLTRRGIGLFLQGMTANIDASVPTDLETLGEGKVKVATPLQVCRAITAAIEDYYIKPYSFQAEKMSFVNQLDLAGKPVRPDELFNTRELLHKMVAVAELAPSNLLTFVETFANAEQSKEKAVARIAQLLTQAGVTDKQVPTHISKAVGSLVGNLSSAEQSDMYLGTRDRRVYALVHSKNADWTAAGKLPAINHYKPNEATIVTADILAALHKQLGALVTDMSQGNFKLPHLDDLRNPDYKEGVLMPTMNKVPGCYVMPVRGPALLTETRDVGGQPTSVVVDDPSKEATLLVAFLHHSLAPVGTKAAQAVDEKGNPKTYNAIKLDPTSSISLLKQIAEKYQFWDPTKVMDVQLMPLLRRDLGEFATPKKTQTPSIE